ncbi:Phosphoglycerate mutase [Sulfuricurvum kujiense DSM 16994]|uniref:Phosphoglycerate mutase n=1 Tax=Sulfuricurvum kujiense (strain ATCC BAA-921 / DSM 16994 / JCM 11577 / YK-1) TaxID=709032 RepID=E4TW72_SULKY|nr:histidine phosphatase family protein [Sulfuricurvum kujiense]ADR32688.1 Phosphoglycerate mutase [Sulfuricurvum kujiense DSM 16994]
MSLTLLRHAALSTEFHGRYIGHTDLPIDTELFAPIILPQMYDAVYSSDLSRCTQTLKQLGYGDFQTDERLREVRFKEQFEGKNFTEIEGMEVYNPRFLESQEQWHDFVCDESSTEFRGRLTSFLDELPFEKNILVCAHGGTIAEILSLLNAPIKRLAYLEYTIVTVK